MSDENAGSVNLGYLDSMRGLAMILVILGHSITIDMADDSGIWFAIRTLIYYVHMPLFFSISGFLYEHMRCKYSRMSIKHFVTIKAKRLMVPYVFFSVLNYSIVFAVSVISSHIYGILNEAGYQNVSIREFLFSVLTFVNHQDNYLWFSYTLFIIFILNKVFFGRITILGTVANLVIMLFPFAVPASLPELIVKICYYMGFFCLGRIIRKKTDVVTKISGKVAFSIFAVLAVVVIPFSGKTYIGLERVTFMLFRICLSLSFIILCFVVLGSRSNKLCDGLKTIGKGNCSSVIYYLHMPFLNSGIVYIMKRLIKNNLVVVVSSFFITISVCLVAYRCLISKVPMVGFFFGNGKSYGEKDA